MEVQPQRSALRFCSRTFHALALKPEPPVRMWLGELDNWLDRSPAFFGGKAIVLDISALDPTRDDITRLVAELGRRNIRILGLEGAGEFDLSPDSPALLTGGRASTPGDGWRELPEPVAAPPVQSASSLLVDSPVRSGQSIVHEEGDVTIIGSVASAAEIIAGGSVHVYGALRGRVLAGAFGNNAARIFCRRLEAELLAIDGNYMLADDIAPEMRGQCIQARLNGSSMEIELQ